MAYSSMPNLGTVLVTGGCGFVGRHLVECLLSSDTECDIIIADVNISRNRIPSSRTHYYQIDISSFADINGLIETTQPRVVFHTASPEPLKSDEALYQKNTLEATSILLQLSKNCKATRAFVMTSSVAVIDDYQTPVLHGNDSMPMLPRSRELYAAYKARAEQLVLASNSRDLHTTTIRPCAIFGPHDHGPTTRILGLTESAAARVQFGDGTNLFDWVYVANVAHAHVLAASKLLDPAADGIGGESFIVTNEEEIAFWDFVRQLGSAIGNHVEVATVWSVPVWLIFHIALLSEMVVWIVSLGTRKSTLYRASVLECTWQRTYSIDKAKQRLGYRPVVSLGDGIKLTSRWWLEEKAEKRKLGWSQ
ncbi:C-3 sterol dehydrogenase/C-4 decarboxylase family protein [Venturia nashicola]|nr:C-3 sterol dehydrogenase/C-4 decarboxylase family protein [Venturia nashicola]